MEKPIQHCATADRHVSGPTKDRHGVPNDSRARAEFEKSERRTLRENDEHWRFLFGAIDEGLCVLEMIFDANGAPVDYRFLEINAAFEQQTGLVGALGRNVRTMLPDLEQRWFDIYGRVAVTGEPIRFEESSRVMNRWFSVYALRVGGAESRKVALIFNDITKRKQAERRAEFLTALSRQLSVVTSETDVIRISTEALGRHLDVDRCYFVECLETENRIVVSPNWLRGQSPSLEGQYSLFEFGGMEWWRHYSAGDFAVEDTETHLLTRDKIASYNALGVRSYAVQPFRQEGAWTVVLAVTDTTPRKWLPEELGLMEDVVARVWPLVERARVDRALRESAQMLEYRVIERTAKLQETIAELEAFSYSISHDLRAPLRAMQSFAAILASDCGEAVGPEGQAYIRRIIAAGERMDRLIQDVLVYSRLGGNDLPLEDIELERFINGVLESYPQFQHARSQIELVTPLARVLANSAALTQCISNLLGNALTFVAPGVKPRIRIWTDAKGSSKVRLYIRDNGIGIPPELQEKIFGMFYQISADKRGTGIGLAVVRKAAERMGGRVSVESDLGKGSTFQLELKAATVPELASRGN